MPKAPIDDIAEGLQLRWGYYNEPAYRKQLNGLVEGVFRLDFGIWNNLGHDFPEYTPFSYFEGGKVVANVSASPMEIVLNGKPAKAFQIGTVATLPRFRGRGLVRALMEKAHAHWDPQIDLSFLFANESVLEMYQRFGYRPVEEHAFKVPIPASVKAKRPARRLDLSESEDRRLLHETAEKRAPVSRKVGVHKHAWLLLFHAAVVYPESLTYVEDLDVVVMYRFKDNDLYLVDIVGEHIPHLNDLLPYIAQPGVETVRFGFTPDLLAVENLAAVRATDSHLFVRGPFSLEGTEFRFPETSRA